MPLIILYILVIHFFFTLMGLIYIFVFVDVMQYLHFLYHFIVFKATFFLYKVSIHHFYFGYKNDFKASKKKVELFKIHEITYDGTYFYTNLYVFFL